MIGPFYCFKFDPQTYEWTRYEITEYNIRTHDWTDEVHYIIPRSGINNMQKAYTNSTKFDRFVNYKVYTFIDDLERAKKIAFDTILVKMGNLEREHNKLRDMLDSLQEVEDE